MVRVFALVSYAAFNASFLYFLAFLSGVTGERPASSAGLAIDLGLLALFAITHSVMARAAFKRRWTAIVGPRAERSVFVLVASVQLALICWQWRALPGPVLWSTSRVLVAGQLLGFAIALASTFAIDHFELFGVRQALGPPRLRTPWLYRIVRHPLYLGIAIALWSAPVMTIGRLVLAAGLTLYIVVGATLEERDLVASFGDDYRRYQREVPMLVPLPGASGQRDSGARRAPGASPR